MPIKFGKSKCFMYFCKNFNEMNKEIVCLESLAELSKQKIVVRTKEQREFVWDEKLAEKSVSHLYDTAKDMVYDNNDLSMYTSYFNLGCATFFKSNNDQPHVICNDSYQRIIEKIIEAKAIYDILKKYDENHEAVSSYTYMTLENIIKNFSENFVSETTITLKGLLSLEPFPLTKKSVINNTKITDKVAKNYKAVYKYLYDVFTNEKDVFAMISVIMAEHVRFSVTIHPPTTNQIIQKNHEDINSQKKDQEKFFKAKTTVKKWMYPCKCEWFGDLFEKKWTELKTIPNISDTKPTVFSSDYMFYRLVSNPNMTFAISDTSGLTSLVAACDKKSYLYDKEFFEHYFDNYEFVLNMRLRNVYVSLTNTKENKLLNHALMCIMNYYYDSNKSGRETIAGLVYKLMELCDVTSNCIITGLKDKSLMKDFVSVAIKFNLMTLLYGNTILKSGDMRKEVENIFSLPNNHIPKCFLKNVNEVFTNYLCDNGVTELLMNIIGYVHYRHQNVKYLLAVLDGGSDIIDLDYLNYSANTYFNWKANDTDHTVEKVNEGSDYLWNLRLLDISKNRANIDRFVSYNDYSFTEEQRGRLFTENDYEDRKKYMIEKFKNYITYLLTFTDIKIENNTMVRKTTVKEKKNAL